MNKIKLFKTESEYNTAKDEFTYPTVAWVENASNIKGRYMEKPPRDYSKEYLTFEALEDGTFTLSIPANVNSTYMTSVSYSTDNGNTWTTTDNTSNEVVITTPTITTGNKVLWKGIGKALSTSYYSKFSATGNFNISGNIMSLLYGDEFENQTELQSNSESNFAGIFEKNTKLVSAKNLILSPTIMKEQCYRDMFYGCTSLTIAPSILPATTLAPTCYGYMFYGCNSLTTTPELPATTLEDNCYNQMFYETNVLPDCTNIDFTSSTVVRSGGLRGLFAGTKVTYNDLLDILPKDGNNKPCLPVTTLTRNCYGYMFYNCTSLTEAPELSATTMANGCYDSMFRGCTALTTAPELPATTLAKNCYRQMFYNCTGLTTVPSDMLPSTTLVANCYEYMFFNCSSLTTAPVLPATALVDMCYHNMFSNCTNLNYIKAMFKNAPYNTAYIGQTKDWVKGVAATGTFVKNSAATWNVTGVNGIPTGWTVQTAAS